MVIIAGVPCKWRPCCPACSGLHKCSWICSSALKCSRSSILRRSHLLKTFLAEGNQLWLLRDDEDRKCLRLLGDVQHQSPKKTSETSRKADLLAATQDSLCFTDCQGFETFNNSPFQFLPSYYLSVLSIFTL